MPQESIQDLKVNNRAPNSRFMTVEFQEHRADRQSRKKYNFDQVFDQQKRQEDVYKLIREKVSRAYGGSDTTVIAFGQTGTGKTFTMDGEKNKRWED